MATFCETRCSGSENKMCGSGVIVGFDEREEKEFESKMFWFWLWW